MIRRRRPADGKIVVAGLRRDNSWINTSSRVVGLPSGLVDRTFGINGQLSWMRCCGALKHYKMMEKWLQLVIVAVFTGLSGNRSLSTSGV